VGKRTGLPPWGKPGTTQFDGMPSLIGKNYLCWDASTRGKNKQTNIRKGKEVTPSGTEKKRKPKEKKGAPGKKRRPTASRSSPSHGSFNMEKRKERSHQRLFSAPQVEKRTEEPNPGRRRSRSNQERKTISPRNHEQHGQKRRPVSRKQTLTGKARKIVSANSRGTYRPYRPPAKATPTKQP